jgi:hypothetical protein
MVGWELIAAVRSCVLRRCSRARAVQLQCRWIIGILRVRCPRQSDALAPRYTREVPRGLHQIRSTRRYHLTNDAAIERHMDVVMREAIYNTAWGLSD